MSPRGINKPAETNEHDEECPGTFRPMRNPDNTMPGGDDEAADPPDALVCPECGALRNVEAMRDGE